MKLVLVEWLDSHSGRGWQDIECIKETSSPLYCRSVGWLVSEERECKVLVPHIAGEKNGDFMIQGSGDITIPDQAIVMVQVLLDQDTALAPATPPADAGGEG